MCLDFQGVAWLSVTLCRSPTRQTCVEGKEIEHSRAICTNFSSAALKMDESCYNTRVTQDSNGFWWPPVLQFHDQVSFTVYLLSKHRPFQISRHDAQWHNDTHSNNYDNGHNIASNLSTTTNIRSESKTWPSAPWIYVNHTLHKTPPFPLLSMLHSHRDTQRSWLQVGQVRAERWLTWQGEWQRQADFGVVGKVERQLAFWFIFRNTSMLHLYHFKSLYSN